MKINAAFLAGALSVSVFASCGGSGAVAPAPRTASHTGRTTRALSSSNQLVETPRTADSFVDSIGVNTHLHYTGTAYADNFPGLSSLLIASGIRHIRDSMIDTTWQPFYDHLNALAAAGIHAELITNVNQSAALIADYPSRVSSALEAVEAPNEYDRSGDPQWATTLTSFQSMLYSAVGGRYPVVGPSLTSEGAYAAVGDLTGSLTYGNMHDYLAGRNPGTLGWGGTNAFGTYATVAYNISVAAQTSNYREIEATETGYGDVGTYAVPPTVKAKYTQRTFFEHFNAYVHRTYIYEFLDEGTDGFGTFGLVTSTLSPKPVYTAVKTLIAQLSDPGATFTPTVLTYGLQAPDDVHHTLLQKHDGTYALALWVEEPGSNPDTNVALSVPAESATLNFATAPTTLTAVTIGDDGNATPVSVGSSTSVTVPLSDRVTIVNVHF